MNARARLRARAVLGVTACVGLAALYAGFETRREAPGVYALSFLYYGLYWLAYRHAAVPPAAFRREAVFAKSLALAALGYVYSSAPADWLSLTVVTSGFLLNASAARVLGADRTYYGRELGAVPPKWSSAFPYSVVPHPMLFGNIAAFGGTLINTGFRETWWPLAATHVMLNIGLLVMETRLAAGVARRRLLAACLGALAVPSGFLLLAGGLRAAPFSIVLLAICLGMHIFVTYLCYTSPGTGQRRQDDRSGEAGRRSEGR